MSTSRVSSVDFRKGVWKDPCKRNLVKNALKGRKVTIEEDRWKVDDSSFQYTTRLNCIKCLFLAAAHHLKMLFKSYKKKYNTVIEHLNNVQNQPTKRDIAIRDAMQQNSLLERAKLQVDHADNRVKELEEECLKIELEYCEKKQEQDNALANLIDQQADLLEYINARNAQAEAIASANKISNNLLSYFSPAEALKKAKALQDIKLNLENALKKLERYPNFKDINWESRKMEELSQMLNAKEQAVQECALQIKENTTSKYSERQKKAQEAVMSAREELERLTEAYKKQLNNMNQSPKKGSRRPSSSCSHTMSSSTIATRLAEATVQPKVEVMTEDISTSSSSISAKEKFLATVAKCNHNFAELWRTLLGKFEHDVVQEFSKNKDGTYEITLKKVLRLWISSIDEKNKENPKGGVIFLVGNNVIKQKEKGSKKEIETEIETRKMCFSLKESTMEFISGFHMYCLTALWMRFLTVGQLGNTIFAKTRTFVYSNQHVFITGEAYGASTTRKKTVAQLLENWGERSLVVDTPNTKDWISTLKLSGAEKQLRIAKAEELKAAGQKDCQAQDN